MPISPQHHEILSSLGLEAENPLYSLGHRLLEESETPSLITLNSQSTTLVFAESLRLELFQAHPLVIQKSPTVELFLKLSPYMKNPAAFLGNIHSLANLKVYSTSLLITSTNFYSEDMRSLFGSLAFENLHSKCQLILEWIKPPASEQHRSSMFQLVAKDEKLWLNLINHLVNPPVSHNNPPPGPDYVNPMIDLLLTTYKPHTLTPKSLCEFAVISNRAKILKLFVHQLNEEDRFEALKLAVKYQRTEMIQFLANMPDIAPKIAKESHELLKIYFNNDLPWHHFSIEVVGLFLNASIRENICFNFEEPAFKIKDTYLESTREQLKNTAQFLRDAYFQTLSAKVLFELWCNSDLQEYFFLDLKDSNGKRVFYTFVKTLLQTESASIYFKIIMWSCVNNKYEIDDLLDCFDKNQIECLEIAKKVKSLEAYTYPKDLFLFATDIVEIENFLLSPSPEKIVPNSFYFHTLMGYAYHPVTIVPTQRALCKAKIFSDLAQKKDQDIWSTINLAIKYANAATHPEFQSELNTILRMLLQNLKNSAALNFTAEEFKRHHLTHPYITALQLKNFDMVQLLLEHDVPPDVIYEESYQNSLLIEIMFKGVPQAVIRLMAQKLHQCPITLNLRTSRGNTPFHIALREAAPFELTDALLNILKEKGTNLDTVNNENMSPFYFALKTRPDIAYRLLMKHSASVTYKSHPDAPNQFCALSLWAKTLSNWHPSNVHKDNFTQFINMGITMLQRGAHCFTQQHNPLELDTINKTVSNAIETYKSLWDPKEENPLKAFQKHYQDVLKTWEIVEQIAQGNIVSYYNITTNLWFWGTRRFFDDKSIFEVIYPIFQEKLQLKATMKFDDTSDIQKLETEITYLSEFLFFLIACCAPIGSISKEPYKTCFDMREALKEFSKKAMAWPKAWPKLEEKERNESEARLLANAQKLYTMIATSKELDAAESFKAYCYSILAHNLFHRDKRENLLICPQTLKFVYETSKEAVGLSKALPSDARILLLKQHAIISVCASSPLESSRALLELFLFDSDLKIDKTKREDIDRELEECGRKKDGTKPKERQSLAKDIMEAVERDNEEIAELEAEEAALKMHLNTKVQHSDGLNAEEKPDVKRQKRVP